MAKTIKCEFCGKEITKGFLGFGGTAEYLDAGIGFDCCEDCAKKYKGFFSRDNGRFDIKRKNAGYLTSGVLSDEEEKQLLLSYYEEAMALREKIKNSEKKNQSEQNFTYVNKAKNFWINERTLGKFSPGKEFVADVEREDEEKKRGIKPKAYPLCFSAEDITRLDYFVSDEEAIGPIKLIYVDVILNDPAVVSYKPSVIRLQTMLGSGSIFTAKQRLEAAAEEAVLEWRELVGATHLTPSKIKKIS